MNDIVIVRIDRLSKQLFKRSRRKSSVMCGSYFVGWRVRHGVVTMLSFLSLDLTFLSRKVSLVVSIERIGKQPPMCCLPAFSVKEE